MRYTSVLGQRQGDYNGDLFRKGRELMGEKPLVMITDRLRDKGRGENKWVTLIRNAGKNIEN